MSSPVPQGRPMIVVITGASSFLASHLIPLLVEQGATIFATYRKSDHRLERLQNLPHVHLVRLDVSKQEDFRQLPQQADALVHIAAESFAHGRRSIGELISCNVIGAQNVARYAQAARIKKVVYTSTVSVYGDVTVPELTETCPITNPDDYGLTKLLAERVFAETEEVSCVALRLPGILGKGAHHAWIPSLVNRVLEGQRKVSIYSAASSFNNAAHVEEVSKFIWLLLNTELSGFTAVNVAADGRMIIKDVIDLMAEVLGEGIEVTVLPAPKPSFTISFERAKNLGYRTRPIQKILRSYFEEAGLAQVKACEGTN
jgi:nucleoside-diphosphate-sugar epimerase